MAAPYWLVWIPCNGLVPPPATCPSSRTKNKQRLHRARRREPRLGRGYLMAKRTARISPENLSASTVTNAKNMRPQRSTNTIAKLRFQNNVRLHSRSANKAMSADGPS